MTIKNLRKHKVAPFEIADENIQRLFSYFLHLAPSIDSARAAVMTREDLNKRWMEYYEERKWHKTKCAFERDSFKIKPNLSAYGLSNDTEVHHTYRSFICRKKKKKRWGKPEREGRCFLRHIRNAIAHGNVWFLPTGRRKYILMEDFSSPGNLSAVLLLAEKDLVMLKKMLSP